MNGFILDTNFISELCTPRPNRGCAEWFGRQDVQKLYLTIITLAEIAQGIFMRDLDAEREEIVDWFERQLPRQFAGRILPLDEKSVPVYGKIAADSRKRGLNRSILDSLIAAIAIANDYPVVTRNKRDFEGLGIKIVNPTYSKNHFTINEPPGSNR